MVDSMARDFEAMVTRRGNKYEWLSAVCSEKLPGVKLASTNAVELIFFSGATDRYDGEIGINNKQDMGGDVSCVAYRLDYKDPIDKNGNIFQTFVLNRLLVNPDNTFKDLLGKPDLTAAFGIYSDRLDEVRERFPVHHHLSCGGDACDGNDEPSGQCAGDDRADEYGSGDPVAENQGDRYRSAGHREHRDGG
jgi:hypothetical protein